MVSSQAFENIFCTTDSEGFLKVWEFGESSEDELICLNDI
jgi:hypothetical protein